MVARPQGMRSDADWQQSTPPLKVARLSLAIASLHADESEARGWVIGFGDVSVAFDHDTWAR